MMQAGKRVQVPKGKLIDVKTVVSSIYVSCKDKMTGTFRIVIEDLLKSLAVASDIQMEVLPAEMKDSIVDALSRLRRELAFLAFDHFSVNDFEFEEGDEIFNIMRDVVSLQAGGD